VIRIAYRIALALLGVGIGAALAALIVGA